MPSDLPPSTDLPSENWIPFEDLRIHRGDLIPEDADFFHAPPPELGDILSAQTTLITSKRPFSTLSRILLVIGLTGLTFFGTVVAFRLSLDDPKLQENGDVAGAILAITVFIAAIYFTRFIHTCTYVGTHGVSEFTLSGNRESTPTGRLLIFEYCHDLTTWKKDHYRKFRYMGTEYRFIWRNEDGTERFSLRDRYDSKEGQPKADSPYWFAVAAEKSWNAFALERMLKQFEQYGSVEFRVDHDDFVRVGSHFLVLHFHGESTRVEPEDIKSLSLKNGTFTIHTKEARWFSRKGKFSFDYSGMGNAELFRIAVRRLAGFSFS